MPEEPKVKAVPRRWHHKYVFAAIGTLLLAAITGFSCWILLRKPPAVVNPFSDSVLAATHFPLYYPAKLPIGYRIDAKSTNIPQAGVVVFNLVSPKGQKIYISEESRPTKFGIGNFYAKLSNLQEVAVSDGAIAAGRLGSGSTEVASRANNQTWILADTNAQIPFNQLIAMLRSLRIGY